VLGIGKMIAGITSFILPLYDIDLGRGSCFSNGNATIKIREKMLHATARMHVEFSAPDNFAGNGS
jgi:hypothetical protein